jgi:hypothetical protein
MFQINLLPPSSGLKEGQTRESDMGVGKGRSREQTNRNKKRSEGIGGH